LGNKQFQAILGLLSDDELSRVLRPHNILERDLAWPLTAGDAAKVLGSVSVNQLRDWDKADLIKPVRYGNGDYRGYFRSHLVQAFLVAKSLDAKWSITGIKHWAGIDRVDPRDPAEGFKDLIALRNGNEDASGLDVLQTSFIGDGGEDVIDSEDLLKREQDQLIQRL
jgi:DNA-binding transcriptional MerR regulator